MTMEGRQWRGRSCASCAHDIPYILNIRQDAGSHPNDCLPRRVHVHVGVRTLDNCSCIVLPSTIHGLVTPTGLINRFYGLDINILNPKLSMFFIAFLPQFVPLGSPTPIMDLSLLSGMFMLITLVVFIGYGLFAGTVRDYVIHSPRVISRLQRSFAVAFAALGAKLALAER